MVQLLRMLLWAGSAPVLCVGCNGNATPLGLPAPEARPLSEIEIGATLFRAGQPTNFGAPVACAACHGEDGSGGSATGIRGVDVTALQDYVQGDLDHPAPTGRRDVKFPELTPEDLEAIAAFLADSGEAM